MIEIVEKSDWNYVLLTNGLDHYLLIPVAYSAVSVHFLIRLTNEENAKSNQSGSDFLAELANQVRYSPDKFRNRNIYNESEELIKQIKTSGALDNMTI
ncbi:hypothetical protein [Reichenbachiella sp.]|uniref:hypothetical protein n=1 Tax=Reichenbachiella sp. TaxID=2184521 RepID=UPI003297C148